MSKYFNLALAKKKDAKLISDSGILVGKLAGSIYFDMLDTTARTTAKGNLEIAVGNKGTGKTSTAKAKNMRTRLIAKFKAQVNVLENLIDDPDVPEDVKILMIDDTNLHKRKETKTKKDHFRFSQETSETPAYLYAQGIPKGAGLHQWKLTEDFESFTNMVLLDPTDVANILLTTVKPKTEYAATHRTLIKGVWSVWEPPITFMTK